MLIYNVPEQYYFRIHHVRPRFKNDIENVLVYIAEKICLIGEKPANIFREELNKAIYQYPGNECRTLKTINNWRTEISSLFGFIQYNGRNCKPGRRAVELAKKQDLVESFKYFLFNFQYPGGHIKSEAVLEQIKNGVRFKPAQYILKLLYYAVNNIDKSFGITKFEVCHCIFNDLRVTRDNEKVENILKLILENRKIKNSMIKLEMLSDMLVTLLIIWRLLIY